MQFVQFVVAFAVVFVAGLWLASRLPVDAEGRTRGGRTVAAIVLVVAAFTAYVVVYSPPLTDCVEHTVNGSGIC